MFVWLRQLYRGARTLLSIDSGGSNSVGKTTLLRVLAGLIGPTDLGERWLGEGFGLALRGSYPVHGLATRDASSQAIPTALLLDDARAPSSWRQSSKRIWPALADRRAGDAGRGRLCAAY